VPENTSYNTSRSTPPTDESSVNIHAHQSALPWHSLSKPIQSNTHVLPCMGTYFFFIYLFTHALCRVTRVSMYGYLFFFFIYPRPLPCHACIHVWVPIFFFIYPRPLPCHACIHARLHSTQRSGTHGVESSKRRNNAELSVAEQRCFLSARGGAPERSGGPRRRSNLEKPSLRVTKNTRCGASSAL